MTDLSKLIGSAIGVAISAAILLSIFPVALARVNNVTVYDQWNTLEEFERSSSLREMLLENDWVDERVDLNDFDYILVLTQQLSEQCFDNVTPALALAVISVESGFRSYCESPKGAQGLMQVVPKYHRERIEKFRYEENVDLFDERLNIMAGMDYLNDILDETEGDLAWALMYYNGGPSYAKRYYVNDGFVSSYATLVMSRMNAIQDILDKGEY